MTTNLKNIFFWISTIAVIALSIYVLVWIKSNSFECVNNTPIYMIKQLEKSNDAEVSCTCSVNKPYSFPVLLTRNGFSKLQTEEQPSGEIEILNYSSLLPNTKK